ncbi:MULTISPECIES: fimbrial protein [Erwinia]|uniref:fimbrial protein n=1 Tax=Erwinia TaxID=551 RepID=UPI00106130B1|nr:fimbrial protein [Erwinia aphidicola]MCP2231223.1 type 1 fimbria pilin [Erwinia aphidicola]
MLVTETSLRAFPTLILALFFLSTVSQAAQQGKGEVSMRGAIVDTACTIATRDAQQSIDLGSLPVSTLAREGKGPAFPLTIRLTDCVLGRAHNNKTFNITFDGPAEGSTFNLQGKASGVALRISDATGRIAKAGVALPPQDITPGDMRLEYFLTLVSDQKPLMAGAYFITVRFKLDYF